MTLLRSDSRLHFDSARHRYAHDGKWLQHSVTQAISDLTQEAKAQIEATKHGPDGWEARGNAVHKAGEEFLFSPLCSQNQSSGSSVAYKPVLFLYNQEEECVCACECLSV